MQKSMVLQLVQASRSERHRVRVACSTCAERKQKCDGRRPCNRCISLKLDDSCHDRHISYGCHRPRRLRIAACSACSHSKVACSTLRPCPRCVRLGLSHSCVTSTIPIPKQIPRVWAREMVPLVATLPFPRSVREFWISWPDSLNKLMALELSFSPEKLDNIFDEMQWALPFDELQKLRNRFDYFQILSENCNLHSSSAINMIQANESDQQEMMPADPNNSPEIVYFRQNGKTSLTMNIAAFTLLGYSADILNDAVSKGIHPPERNPNLLPFVYKLFHPDSWLTLSKAFLNFYLFGPLCQRFYCQLARCDGRPLPVLLTLSIWIDKHNGRNFHAKYSFTVVETTVMATSLALPEPSSVMPMPSPAGLAFPVPL